MRGGYGKAAGGAWLMRRVLAPVFLLLAGLFVCTAGAGAQPTAPSAASVWYADGARLAQLDAGAGTAERSVVLPAPPSSLAVHPTNGTVYALVGKELFGYDASGELLFQKVLDLKDPQKLQRAPGYLTVSPDGRSVWVAGAGQVLRLDGRGELQATAQKVPFVARDIVPAQDGSTWVQGLGYLRHIAGDGRVLYQRKVNAELPDPRHLALDEPGGYAYVSNGSEVMRVGLKNETGAARKLKPKGGASGGVAVDPTDGTLFVANDRHLSLYNRELRLEKVVALPASGAVRDVAFDASGGGVWVGAQKKLLGFTAGGDAKAGVAAGNLVSLGAAPFSLSPQLSVLEPADGALTKDPAQRVRLDLDGLCNGHPCPANLGYEGRLRVEATLNGQRVDDLVEVSGGEAVYAPAEGLPEGQNSFVATAVGPYGERSDRASTSFTVDTTAPRFSGVRPEGGATVSERRVVVSGRVDDPEARVYVEGLDDLGGEVLSDDPVGFRFAVPLTEGYNDLRLLAYDGAGNVGEHPLTLAHDPPVEISITDPARGATVETDRVSVRGSVEGPEDTRVRVGEVAASVADDGVFVADGVRLAPGQNDLVVAATTPGGKTVQTTLGVYYEEPGDPTGTEPGLEDDAPTEVRTERPPDSPVPSPGTLPEDPQETAPPVGGATATDTAASTEFLYQGPDAVQQGVEAGALDEERVAVLRGRVADRAGQPVPGVRVTVSGHPEYGETLTREDGGYDLAVEGGSTVTLDFEKDRYMPAQRQVDAPWLDFAAVDEVVMAGYSRRVTDVDLAGSEEMLVAQGAAVTDEEGTRRATMLLPGDATARMVMPDGTEKPLPEMDLRATEYTVGEDGPESMPGPLPPTSAYTYAVEISADEAVEAGAETVEFSEPIYNYVQNYLGFPVGTDVPNAYYDREKAAWVPSEDGRIVEVLSEQDGLVTLDVDGSGTPAGPGQLEDLGVTGEELGKLAGLYEPGESLWRVPIPHLTPWDHNWPYGPPDGAASPDQPGPGQDPGSDEDCSSGSIIRCQTQVLGEVVGVSGAPFSLHYGSDRAPGRSADRTLDIPVTGETVPSNVKRIELEVRVAGRTFEKTFQPRPNQEFAYTWDGRDAYGRSLKGEQDVEYKLDYVYDLVYQQPAQFRASFAALSGRAFAADRSSREISLSQEHEAKVSSWDASAQALGGWTPDIVHQYDPEERTILLGDGDRRSAESVNNVATTAAGTGTAGFAGDGGPATRAGFRRPGAVAVASDGTLYVADTGNNRVRKVTTGGVVSTVAGTGTAGFAGDGGPAAQARLSSPGAVAVAPDGALYVADTGNDRVRRVGVGGNITTVAGSGVRGFAGDEGPAGEAQLGSPEGVAVSADGTIYISDTMNNRIRKVSPAGTISTVAGTGTAAFSGDGGPASEAAFDEPEELAISPDGSVVVADTGNNRVREVGIDGLVTTIAGNGGVADGGDGKSAVGVGLYRPSGVAFGPDGSLYIADSGHDRIRRVDGEGFISTVAGTGQEGYSGDGAPAPAARLSMYRSGISVAPDGALYAADNGNNRIREVSPPMPGTGADDITVASEDGGELYVFGSRGRHLRTLDSMTGAVVYEFTYDDAGRVAQIRDIDGLVTEIQRDPSGNVTVVAPAGERTELAFDEQGYLKSVANPAGETLEMAYGGGGLLTSLTDPRNNATRFTYDERGRLVKDEDPAGGYKALSRSGSGGGYSATLTKASGPAKNYGVVDTKDGGSRRVNTDANGLKSETIIGADGAKRAVSADGTVLEVVQGPDPRFGMQTPVLDRVTLKTPGGLSTTTSVERRAVLQDAGDPLSFSTMTETTKTGDAVSTSTYDKAARTVTSVSAEGRKVTSTLDARGRVIREESPGFVPTTYAYDERGRLTQATTGTGAEARTSTYAYDEKDRLSVVTDPLGGKTRYEYDAAGRVTEATTPDGRALSYSYDANGNLTSLSPPGKPAHEFGYDSRNLGTTYTAPGTAEEPTSTEFDLDKRPKVAGLPGGEEIQYLYDGGGRLSELRYPGGEKRYAYDDKTGAVVSQSNPSGKLSYTYDGLLPLTETSTGVVPGKVSMKYGSGLRVTETSVNGGPAVSFGYDKDGMILRAGALQISRDRERGLVTGTTLAGVTDSRSYDGFGEVTGYEAVSGATGHLKTAFKRDSLGRIAEKTETTGGVSTTYAYTYDAADRLSEVKKDGAVVASYTYDENGNRLSREAGGQRVEGRYDGQDRLLSYGDNEYTYSPEGDLESKTDTKTGEATAYDYDALGNLASVVMPGGKKIEYVMDAGDRRVGKKVDGRLTQGFIYSGQRTLMAELDGSGNVVSRFVYGTRGHVPDYMVRGGVTYRMITDHLGSPRLVVNAATGEVAQRMDYDEFGNVVRDTNPGFQPFGFAGGIYDQDTKLTKFGARDYDAETGRWTRKDPIGFSGGDSNLYAYAANDPVNYIDPSGLFLDTIVDVASIGYDVYRIVKDNVIGNCDNLGTNLAALGADVALTFVPFGTGGGMAVRAGARYGDEVASAADDVAEAGCRMNSFDGDTPVLMSDGKKKPISEVNIGDYVTATDPETGETASKRVTDVIVSEGEKRLVDLTIDGEATTATDEHPFFVREGADGGGEWVDAEDLEAGDRLLTPEGGTVEVEKVRRYTEAERVYNLTVEGVHTFYVQSGGQFVLVHNCNPQGPEITVPYKRPGGATTKAQRESVQGKPCVTCGTVAPKQYADHKNPLVKEYYETGNIDRGRMRSPDAVQPQCPTCSNKQGADMSRYSKGMRKKFGL